MRVLDGDSDSAPSVERDPATVAEAAGHAPEASDAEEESDDGREGDGRGRRPADGPEREAERRDERVAREQALPTGRSMAVRFRGSNGGLDIGR
ncbi:hypothetical protein [Natrinema salaciae]|uniref:hypothetical protein n=1 Tax=Natrinema salaciae TaxID=1186196 RepID=UPI000B821CE4|nr:hypothetical protein [Natrinema salaciae]